MLLAPIVAALWVAVVLRGGDLPRAALTLELAAMLGLTLAAAALAAARLPDRRGGLVAAPLLVGFLTTAALTLPSSWTLFAAGPADPRWETSHALWGAVLGLGLAALLFASLDAGRPRRALRILRRFREPIGRGKTTSST